MTANGITRSHDRKRVFQLFIDTMRDRGLAALADDWEERFKPTHRAWQDLAWTHAITWAKAGHMQPLTELRKLGARVYPWEPEQPAKSTCKKRARKLAPSKKRSPAKTGHRNH